MSDAFSDREKGFEAKFKNDADFIFKAESRRNRLLGEWLADQFGIEGDAKKKYAKDVVIADLDEPGIDDVVGKVMADIKENSSTISEADVRAKIVELDAVAIDQLKSS